MSRLYTLSTAFLAVLLAAGVASAEALWPEFRGPGGQGHSTATGLPLEWAPDKNVVWRAALPGVAWSSPVVANGKIFLTDAAPLDSKDPDAGVSLRVTALTAATGKVAWDREIFRLTDPQALRKHDKNSHASPSPVYEKGRIYAHFGHHGTACVDETGKVLWSTQENRYPPVHGTGGSPVIVDDLLIFNTDGASDPAVLALDKATGKVRWKAPRPMTPASKFSFSTPLLITVKGRPELISAGSGIIQALNPKDGTEIWHVLTGNGFSVVPRPVFAQGLLFLSSGYQQPTGYAIRPDGAGDVTATHVAWTLAKRVPLNPSMLVVGEELYMLADSGVFSCVDAKTGKVHYEERLLGSSSASLLSADGRIYAIDEQGKSAVVKPGKTFELLATNELQERTLASMAVCDSDLLVRTEKALYRIGKDGKRP
ncbi:MAG: serine/threonine protein kinase [Armatimonadetes bacterium]|nr:serine/threonine protein kinase [Armatimonadota bacterium]